MHDPKKANLRQQARAWMHQNNFFDTDGLGFSSDNLYFEDDRIKKVDRIAQIGITHFVDDLLEVFEEPRFPPATKKILFATEPGQYEDCGVPVYRSWNQIFELIFADAK